MDCSSFSSSSVRVRFLGAEGPGRDMLSGVSDCLREFVNNAVLG